MPDNILEFCAIIDYQGFGYYNLDLTLTRNAIDTYQNYYPNRLGAVFLVIFFNFFLLFFIYKKNKNRLMFPLLLLWLGKYVRNGLILNLKIEFIICFN